MPTTYKGTLNAFHGSWMSGLATLVIDGQPVMCENGATVRALHNCFGDVIAAGHTVDSSAFAGKEIVYSVDDMGVLIGFTPTDEWTGPEIPEEGIFEEDEGGY
jgi:hypothetical protein